MGIPYIHYRIDDLALLDILTLRERYIVERRIGLHGKPQCFREIGEQLGICGSYVHDIEFIALCKMRIPYVMHKYGKRKVEHIANTKRRVVK